MQTKQQKVATVNLLCGPYTTARHMIKLNAEWVKLLDMSLSFRGDFCASDDVSNFRGYRAEKKTNKQTCKYFSAARYAFGEYLHNIRSLFDGQDKQKTWRSHERNVN